MARQRYRYPPRSSPESTPDHPGGERRAPAPVGRRGLGVDHLGGPVIDPTANVLALVEAANRRQDDLREMNNARIDAELRNQETIADLRAKHQEAIDALEAKRLDAVRNVDQITAKTEADRAATAVTALATAGNTTATVLRATVDTRAQELATQFASTVGQLTERIAALEKSSYTGQGKQAVVDPQVTEMLVEMRALRAQQASRGGEDTGRKGTQDQIKSLVALGFTAVLLMIALATFFLKTTAAAPPAAPQIIYTPAPPGTQLPSSPPTMVPR